MSQSEFAPLPDPKPGQIWRTMAGGLYEIKPYLPVLPFELVELVQDEHGFTIWRGCEQPVKNGTRVECRFQNGGSCGMRAEDYTWSDPRLVAYKVVETAKDPSALIGSQDGADALEYAIDMGAKDGDRHVVAVEIPPGYEGLFDVLVSAFKQASAGKGKERHASAGVAFEDQPISAINRTLGSVDGLLYQAAKKSTESRRLPSGRAQAEIFGAINYLAAAAIAYDTWYAESLPKN